MSHLRFDPFRVGLDHLALAVDNAESLYELKQQLHAAGVRNNGVQDDTLKTQWEEWPN
jgi:hypothetical protein